MATFIHCGPLDLEATLDGGQAFRWYPEAGGYRGVIGDRVVHISPAADGLRVAAVDGRPVADLAVVASDYLGMGSTAYDEFRACYEADQRLGDALGCWPGLRILRQDPWECLVAFIASANSSIPRIKQNIGAIAGAFGTRIGTGEHDRRFPDPATIASAGEGALRELGLGFRAPYIARAAERVAAGEFDFDLLRTVPYVHARAVLMSLDGVGEKIADCVLAFSLGKRDAFPVDRWVRRALEERCGMPPSLNNSKAADWARARFGDHGAYVNQYLFHRQRLAARGPERVLPAGAASARPARAGEREGLRSGGRTPK